MKRSLKFIPALFMLGIAAVAIPGALNAASAKYHAASPKGGAGWAIAELPDGRVAVSYTGDSRTKKDDVAKYAFLRAAEYTDEKGFEWFAVIASTVHEVEVGSADDLAGRTGNFIGSSSAGTGAGSDQSAGTGGGSSNVNMGPSTGGFGGGDVPPSMLESWRAKKVPQAVLIIQMGKGDQANFEGVTQQPEIFEAKATIEELRPAIAK